MSSFMIEFSDKPRQVVCLVALKEIAAETGVSVMTVSNVIHHHMTRVSPETAERVRAIIDQYHDVPNMAARRK